MECPICGSDEIEILNSKQKSSKKKLTEEYLLKCDECGHVFKDAISLKKPQPYRLIISEQDKSHKTTIDLSPSLKSPALKLEIKGSTNPKLKIYQLFGLHQLKFLPALDFQWICMVKWIHISWIWKGILKSLRAMSSK